MGGKNYDCLNALRCYLEDESLDKKKVKLIMDNWNCENVKVSINRLLLFILFILSIKCFSFDVGYSTTNERK